MKAKNRIINVSPTLFLNSLPSEKHAEVKGMFVDPAVDYIVLLIEKDGDARHVVPVGEQFQYSDITTFTPESIDGMRAIASVDAHQPLPDLSKLHSPRKHTVAVQSTKLEKFACQPKRESPSPASSAAEETLKKQSQDQIRELNRMLAEERARTMLKDRTIAELTKRIEQMEVAEQAVEMDQPVSNSVDESLLIERENSVLKAEEDLIKRLTYLMEKEAELEQYEEDLEYRTGAVDAQVNKDVEEEEAPALPL